MDCSIIGISIRLPEGLNEEGFWKALVEGRSFLQGMSTSRQALHAKGQSRLWGDLSMVKGMYLDEIDCFDRHLFNLSKPALMFSDPRQRLLLESCWSAIENAGLRVSALKGKKVGVFIAQDGFEMSSYFRNISDTDLSAQEFVIPGNVTSFLANRISNIFDFKGPSMVIDSTCSSIYVALHHARQALEKGECDYALVGGATLFLEPWKTGENSPTSFESGVDEIKSFQEAAIGYCSSEGCGALLLQKSSPEVDKKHEVYGVITGSGYNSGGKTSSFAQPSQQQQEVLFRTVLKEAQKNPEEIFYIESHGIGSEMGDAIEANALINVFGNNENNPCYVSTIKPNIGHTHASSGLYSLFKALLSLKYEKIPLIKGFHSSDINKTISKKRKGIEFLTQSIDWNPSKNNDKSKIAFLSSYGFSNVNSAILIQEAKEKAAVTVKKNIAGPALVCLSAETKEQLDEQRIRLLDFLTQKNRKHISLSHLAYTLQVGREALRYRFAAEIKTVAQLKRVLGVRLETSQSKKAVFLGDTEHPISFVSEVSKDGPKLQKHLETCFKKEDLSALAKLWVNGIDMDWDLWYKGKDLKRLHLPTYPFAREPYWIPNDQKKLNSGTSIEGKLHPLVHQNTSTLNIQRFTSTYVGTESFLLGHQVNGIKCLAGESHLEAARAAGTMSLNTKITQVKDVTWLNLIKVIDKPKEVHIRLWPTKVEGDIGYEIYSDTEEGELIHSQGKLGTKVFPMPANIDVKAIRDRLQQTVDLDKFYNAFTEKGLTFGKNYQGLASYFYSEKEALGEIILTEEEEKGYIVSPGVIDNALQTAVGWVMGKENVLNLPFSLKEVNAFRDLPSGRLWAYVQKSKDNKENSITTRHDIDLVNDDGEVLMSFKDFVFRNLDNGRKANDTEHTTLNIKEKKIPKPSLYANTDEEESISQFEETSIRYIKGLLAKELRLSEEEFELDIPFEKYGIDSMLVNRLTNRLEEEFGRLDRTLFFEYQNLRELIEYFIAEHTAALYQLTGFQLGTSADSNNSKNSITSAEENQHTERFIEPLEPTKNHQQVNENGDIAIIGIGGRYPAARNVNEFWENLKSGKDSITEIPHDRWDMEGFYDTEKGKVGKSYSKWGGFIDDMDAFDPLFFNIAPKEAQLMDPQERLFLQTVWETIEDAGYTRDQLKEKDHGKNVLSNKTGVYVGVMFQDYSLLGAEYGRQGNAVSDGISGNIANRVSYFFDFHGPSLVLDTMCSSSLTAIHMACQGLRSGDTQLAIAGGVNVSAHPNKYLMLCQKQFLSSKGKCESFGDGGDGYVPGEGTGAVLLKPLAKAKADGDRIYAVIKGSSLNHGGKTNGYTVPNPKAQAALIRETIEKADVRAEDFSYIEAHGTGTSLGDPIEISGLSKAFASDNKQYCNIGSVKSNIGHCESAAGIAGITKVVLQMQHKTLVPSLHSKTLNQHIDFKNTPFKVQQELADWTTKDDKPRLAGISSFGAGGSNAHIILEEYTSEVVTAYRSEDSRIIILSAKNKERLQEHAANLEAFLEEHKEIDLHDVAYTLQTGREAMEERLVFIVKDIKALTNGLSDYIKGETKNVMTGNSKKDTPAFLLEGEAGKGYIDIAIRNKELKNLAQLWVMGVGLDWELLYAGKKPRKISLPTYPFTRERYWLERNVDPTTDFSETPGISFQSPTILNKESTSSEQPAKLAFSNPPESNGQISESVLEKLSDNHNSERICFTPYWKASELLGRSDESPKSSQGITIFVATDNDSGIIEKIKTLNITDHVIQLPPSEEIAKQVQNNTLQLFEYCKKLITNKKNNTEKLLVYVPYKDTDFPYRSLMGILRSVSLESPFLKTKLIFDSALHNDTIELVDKHLKDEISFWDDFSEVLYDQNQSRLVLTQKQIHLDSNNFVTQEIRRGGVYLITGGMGGLGRIFARYLGAQVDVQLILTGRSSLTSEKKAVLETLSSKGIQARYISCDINDKTETAQMVNNVVQEFGTIHGVIHSAGCIRDNYCINKTTTEMLEVLSPKVMAVTYLDEATKDLPLDFFTLFSSIASLGSAGQTDYATGNAFMDVFASYREGLVAKGMRKGKSISVNWPLWKEGGMTPGKPYEEAMFKNMGMLPLEKELGIQAFEDALVSDENQFGIIRGNVQKIRKFLNIQTSIQDQHRKQVGLTKEIIQDTVLEAVSKIIGVKKSAIDPSDPLIDYGVDSIALMELGMALNTVYNSNYTGAAFLELNTVELITTHLYQNRNLKQTLVHNEKHQGVKSSMPVENNKPEANKLSAVQQLHDEKKSSQDSHRLAVIGYDCKFPEAENPEAFWENITNNVVSIKNIQPSDWEKRDVVCNGKYSSMKWAGLMNHIDQFDAPFWGINAEVAEQMDPQLRLLLRSIWHGIEHAGYAADKFAQQRVGVFIAADAVEYEAILKEKNIIPGLETVLSVGMLANKVSYYCNFNGPSESIDNACSSVYVALNQAQRAISGGACDVAIVGGVKLLLDSLGFTIREQLISKSGNLRSFDTKADGYIRGEGVGCLVLKPVERAKKDRDHIHAIVAGTSVTHNGKEGLSSLAPSVEAQYRAIEATYQMAGVDPETVHYIEAHGTATDFNDAAEITAYKKFFKASMDVNTYTDHRCAISTVKPNIGHLEGASGIASLIKGILALKHRQIPPTARFSNPHPALFLEDSPFYIPTAVHNWERTKNKGTSEEFPKRVALHTVGITGVNAHVILEESLTEKYIDTSIKTDKKDGHRLFIISARSKNALAAYGKQWLKYLESVRDEGEDKTSLLANIAYSSQVAREAMSYRQVFVVNDIETLKTCLQQQIKGVEKSQSNTHYFVSNINTPVTKTSKNRLEFMNDRSLDHLATIANNWIVGEEIDWELFSKDENLERVTIPNYPFENERYWCDTPDEDSFEKLFHETFKE